MPDLSKLTPSEQRRIAERDRYLDTLTPASRDNFHRVRTHQFADSIGGDSSNYRF